MYNTVLERIHQVLGNLVRNFNIDQTYVDEDDPWSGILAAAAFEIHQTTNSKKCYIPGQFIFGHDIILPINQLVYWGSLRQQKQTQINKDNTRENRDRVDHDYKVGDNVMLTNHNAYKYESKYKGPFVIT